MFVSKLEVIIEACGWKIQMVTSWKSLKQMAVNERAKNILNATKTEREKDDLTPQKLEEVIDEVKR